MHSRDQPWENNVEEVYLVPEEFAGLIIGRGGEQIKRLQAETGCNIQISPRINRDPNRCCTLTGRRESVESAKSMLEKIVEESGQYVLEMMIPGPQVGRLIGKDGDNLRKLQEECGVRMVVIQDGPEPTVHAKPLRISGDQENVEYAERRIENFLSHIEGSQRFVPGPFRREVLYHPDREDPQEQSSNKDFLWLIFFLFILFIAPSIWK